MITITWLFTPDNSKIVRMPNDQDSSTSYPPWVNYVITNVFDKELTSIFIVPDSLCTCEIQATPISLKPYQIRLDNSYVFGDFGALINIPGVRIELSRGEIFLFTGTDQEEDDLLTQFIR